MKNTLFFMFVFYSVIANAQWTKIHTFNSETRSIHFPVDSVGYAYTHKPIEETIHSYKYTLVKTVDYGQTWASVWSGNLSTDHGHDYVNYKFTSPNTVYRVHKDLHNNRSLVRSFDGGVTWEGLYESFGECYYHPVNDSLIYYTTESWDGKYSYLIKSNLVDSDTILSSSTNLYKNVVFTNDSTGYISYSTQNKSSEVWSLLKTDDYGKNWSVSKENSLHAFKSIHFPTEKVGYVTTNSGFIYRTTNAGQDWYMVDLKTKEQINSFAFFKENIGYAVGDNGLTIITENGIDWEKENSLTSKGLRKISLPSDTTGYILTYDNEIYKKGYVSEIKEIQSFGLPFNFYPNPVKDVLNIKIEAFKDASIEIYDVSGNIIKYIYPMPKSHQIDVSEYRNGLYFVKYTFENESKISKLIKTGVD